jgi:hypothetical protein
MSGAMLLRSKLAAIASLTSLTSLSISELAASEVRAT